MKKGFTLVEVVLSMSLIAVLLAASTVLMGRGLDAFNLISSHTDALEQARYGLLRMEREIEGVTNIQGAGGTDLDFVDGQGLTTDFHLTGTTLMRGNDPMVRNVTGLTFTYYDSSGATTNAAPQVRLIRIAVTVQAPNGGGSVFFRTEIYPRNFTYDTFL